MTSNPNTREVSDDDVRWAYRLILGREPESHAVLAEHRAACASIAELRARFLASDEFRTGISHPPPLQSTGFEPPPDIERVQDAELRQRLLDHIASGWSHYGETDPHWSVLTEDRFRKERLDENRAAFDAIGKHSAERFFSTLARNRIEPASGGHCVELGCGVGRVTRWLAPRFGSMTAIDVSAGHLALARAHLATHSDRVEFMQLRRVEDLDALKPIDAFYSFIVLQHNPPPVIEAMLERIFARIADGGVAFFQVPTYIPGYRFDARSYLRHRAGKLDMEMHALPQATIFEIADRHRMRTVEALCEIVDGVVSDYFLMRKAAA